MRSAPRSSKMKQIIDRFIAILPFTLTRQLWHRGNADTRSWPLGAPDLGDRVIGGTREVCLGVGASHPCWQKRAPRPMKTNRGAHLGGILGKGGLGPLAAKTTLRKQPSKANTAARFTFLGLTSNVGALAYSVSHCTCRHQRYNKGPSEVAADNGRGAHGVETLASPMQPRVELCSVAMTSYSAQKS
jgi:hypothetical protein